MVPTITCGLHPLPLVDCRVLDVFNVFDDVAADTRQGLDRQASLIASVDSDIELASRIQTHLDFLSLTASRAMVHAALLVRSVIISRARGCTGGRRVSENHGILHAPVLIPEKSAFRHQVR
jgi:hypothetical protein